jgi:hypothetical protein
MAPSITSTAPKLASFNAKAVLGTKTPKALKADTSSTPPSASTTAKVASAKTGSLIAIGNTGINPNNDLLKRTHQKALAEPNHRQSMCLEAVSTIADKAGFGHIFKGSRKGENNVFQSVGEALASGLFISVGTGKTRQFNSRDTGRKDIAYRVATEEDILNAPSGALVFKTMQPDGFRTSPTNIMPGRSNPSSRSDIAVKIGDVGTADLMNYERMPSSSVYGNGATERIVLVPKSSIMPMDDNSDIAVAPTAPQAQSATAMATLPQSSHNMDNKANLEALRTQLIIANLAQGLKPKTSPSINQSVQTIATDLDLDPAPEPPALP